MLDNLYYIDIHAHVLPGVDDGPESIEETMEIIDIAYNEGFRAIMATPHYGVINPGYDPAETERIRGQVAARVKERYPEMLILQGNELYYGSAVLEGLQDGRACTLAGSDYVLVEFDVNVPFGEMERGLSRLISSGYRPVLAHAERYSCIGHDVDLVADLVDQGVYIQINARTFLRKRLDKKFAFCRKLVKNGLVHFAATDCHNTDSRKPVMDEVVGRLLKITDEETVRDLVFRNGIKVMKNEFI